MRKLVRVILIVLGICLLVLGGNKLDAQASFCEKPDSLPIPGSTCP